MIRILLALLVSVSFLFPLELQAQSSSNKGKEFWVGFMAHRDASRVDMYLYITSDSSTTGKVEIPGQNWSQNFTVTANNMTLVTIPNNVAYVGCTDCIQGKGIKVTAAKNVVVYAHIYYNYRSDATLVLPTKTIGKDYYAMSYEMNRQNNSDRTQFMIIANQDNTKVNITPSVDIQSTSGTRSANSTYQITLDAGEVYQAQANGSSLSDDITGTKIEVIDTGSTANCRTVSVFAGSNNTRVGCTTGFNSADNLFEQMYPVNSWGTRFIYVPMAQSSAGLLRVLAAEDNTNVLIYHKTGAPTQYVLDAGEYDGLDDKGETKYIIASKPICLAQYSKTQACAGANGDPAMTIINPIEQTLTDITVYSSRYEAIRDHYINVVIPTSSVSSFRVDGVGASFTQVPRNARYSYAQLKVSQGNHRLTANEGFVATAYGFGRFESYGYAAGANVKDLTAKIDLTNSSVNDDFVICLGGKAKFEGSAEYKVARYEWDFGDGTGDTVQAPSHVYQDTGTFSVRMYTFKETYDGCSNYDSTFLTLKVTGPPTARFVSTLKCEGNNVTFTDSSYAKYGEPIGTRIWSFHSGPDAYGPSAIKYYDTAGEYYLRLIVRTEFQCADTITDTVTINPNPVVDFQADKSCQYDSTKFVNLTTIKSGVFTSRWDFGDGDTSVLNSPSHFYQDSGSYEVQLTVTSDSLCQATHVDTVYKYATVDLDFSFTDTCQGLSVDFDNLTTNNGANITSRKWILSTGDTLTDYSFTKTFDTAGTFTAMLWIEIDSFCRDSLTKTFEVYPLVESDFWYSSTCTNDSIKFKNLSTISSGTVNVISWDVDDGNTYYADSFSVKYSSSGSKDITLTTESDKGCRDVLQSTIDFSELNTNGLDFQDVCKDVPQTITLDYTISGDTITSWNWEMNSTVVSTSSSLDFEQSTAGDYVIRLVLSTTNNCFAEIVDTVTVFEDPTADFDVTPVCEGEDLTPTNNSGASRSDVITAQSWYFDGAFESIAWEPTITTTSSGTHIIALVVESDKGCLDTMEKTIDINPLPNVDFAVNNVCLGDNTTFTDQSTVTSGSIIGYSWRFDDGTTANGSTTSRTFPAIGTYSLTHIVVTDQGCTDSTTKQGEIFSAPVIDIEGDSIAGCPPFTPSFTNNTTIPSGTIQGYKWIWGDGDSTTGDNPGHTYPNSGVYQIEVEASSDNGCVSRVSVPFQIEVYDLPIADFVFTPEEPSTLESTVQFQDASTADVVQWDWNMGDGGTYNIQNPLHEFTGVGVYNVTLHVTNSNGCEDEITKILEVTPDLFIWVPNSFSPNGDLINDYWGASGILEGITNYKMEIYNRWGEKIFATYKTSDRWDGTYKGELVPMGFYIYKMEFTDFRETQWFYKKGEIHLIY